MNQLLITGIAVNTTLAVTSALNPEIDGIGYLFGSAILVQLVGLVLMVLGSVHAGARCVQIGGFFSVPIGSISMFGASQAIDGETEAEFATMESASR